MKEIMKVMLERIPKRTYYILPVIVLLVISPYFLPYYTIYLLSLILAYAIFAMAFDLLCGYTGLISLGHSLFFGIGAYTFVLSILNWKLDLWAAMALGCMASSLIALVVGYLSIRVRGVYFLILTFIFSLIAFILALHFVWLTGGENGLSFERPLLTIFGLEFSLYERITRFHLILGFFLATFFLLRRIVSSPLGLALRSVRENEELASTLGYNVRNLKLFATGLSGLFSGLAGILYSLLNAFITADAFSLTVSLNVLVWTLIGGAGTLIGPVIGTGILVYLFDYLSRYFENYWLITGLLLLVIMRYGFAGIWVLRRKWG